MFADGRKVSYMWFNRYMEYEFEDELKITASYS